MLSYGSILVSIPIWPVPVSEICHKTLAPELTRQSSGSYKYLPELLNTLFVTVHGYQNALLALLKRSSQCPVVGRVRSGKWKNIHATLPCSNLKRGQKTRMLPEWSPYFRIRYSVRVSVLGSMLTMLTNAIPRMVNLASHVPHLVLQTLLAARLT